MRNKTTTWSWLGQVCAILLIISAYALASHWDDRAEQNVAAQTAANAEH